jgi:murein DD-endopeptidase MepM/ murein hydrolase activator NlpD
LNNLDILRWNQIWLKTPKGDVVFYSHLEDVSTHVKEWMMVRKGETIWTIGISGVPEKGYTDYHLHFVIQKNPYNKRKNQQYSYLDYMKWDWYFKWQPKSEVLKYQNDIFKSEY